MDRKIMHSSKYGVFFYRCCALRQVQYFDDANLLCTLPILSVARIFSIQYNIRGLVAVVGTLCIK